jgi:prepilin-type N-terminal cleavage/methylation domain-containing protein
MQLFKSKRKKGFTLIELIVVMAVLGILVLLTTPKLIGYVDRAKETVIVNDVRIAENNVLELLITGTEKVDGWEDIDISELELAKSENKLYDIRGLVSEDIEDGNYRLISEDYVKKSIGSNLKGKFYVSENAKVYYVRDKSGKAPKPEVIEGSFKWKKYKITNVVDVKTENAIGKTSFLFSPIFIFENNLNLEPNALYNVLLSGKTFDTEDQLVDKEYTFNHITSQNLASDNQLLKFGEEQGGYRIIKKANDLMELAMEVIAGLKRESGLVGLFDFFKEEKELFLDAYKDYDNIEELISSLLESFEIKYGFTPEIGDITESEFLLFLMLTDSSIISNYFEDDYETFEEFAEDLENVATDLFGYVPNADWSDLLILFAIVDLSNYVVIGDTWAIEIGELSTFSQESGQSLDRIKIEKLQEVGFVGGEEGDYPENGEVCINRRKRIKSKKHSHGFYVKHLYKGAFLL